MSKCLIVPLKNPGKTVHLGNKGSTNNGTTIYLWDRLPENDSAYLNQVWLWNGKNFQSAKNPKKALVLQGTKANGTKVKLWDFVEGKHQEWILEGENIVSSWEPSRCWHLAKGNTGNGTHITIWDKKNHANGRWAIEYLEKEKELENTEKATLEEQTLEDEHCKEWTVDEQPYRYIDKEGERKDAVCGPMPCIRACIIL